MNTTTLLLAGMIAAAPVAPAIGQTSLRDEASAALRRGAAFFREQVAVEGTYLWQYSEDLQKREGEGKASATKGWIQPPGTPAVGSAFLAAYEATGNRYYLDAARETAGGLIRGQLMSGGWTYHVDFDPRERKKLAYREGGDPKARNVTTFDDDTTQSAIRFLMRLDRALRFEDDRIHQCTLNALESLLKAQYPNGAWPQGYQNFPQTDGYPVKKASYPPAWPKTWPGSQQYWLRYTLNDNTLATIVETLFEASRIYSTNSSKLAHSCRAAALKAGDFLILAQMPEPQPAWAQQYDFDMQPTWARKFEPPAITAGESQKVMETLLAIYRETNDRKYIEPLPKALAFLKNSRLPDGKLARFYELRSNKPLYFTKEYALTYDDSDVPTHYAFKVTDRTETLARQLERATNSLASAKPQAKSAPAAEVKRIIGSQDAQGRWIEQGRLRSYGGGSERVIRSETFVRNMEALSRYLAAQAAE